MEASALPKIGIISGSGELPAQVIESCKNKGREIFVICFEGITDKAVVDGVDHKTVHIGKVGAALRALKKAKVKEVLLAGMVGRPAPSSLKLDFAGVRLLKTLGSLPSQGDDVVFSAIIEFIEKRGFTVVGADNVLSDLLIAEGPLGDLVPDDAAKKDIEIGMNAALEIGKLDIGQAVIIQQGNILKQQINEFSINENYSIGIYFFIQIF